MKISVKWLKDYVETDLSSNELAKGLSEMGLDIESVYDQGGVLKNFVIGKVLETKKHPNADKLTVCKVNIGTETLNIVCGASNVAAGQFVCVAKEGAVIPNSGVVLKKTKIRSEVSEGMICSAKEMNLGEDHEGIMVLDEFKPLLQLKDRLVIGRPFADYLGSDVVFDIGVTPNRGDLLSHIGVAREVGFLIDKKIKTPAIKKTSSTDEISNYITVQIDEAQACRRYCGSFVKNVTVKDSPKWLKEYLDVVGLRPINNIVDVTNFVMLECGQPLHAFDYNRIAGKKILVKNAGKLKTFITLDGKERKLNDDILLICDAEKPLGIAGIMGGQNSEIRAETKNVFIESAFFDPVNIRKCSKFLGVQTDSSYRFERGVDIDTALFACKRAASLIAESSGGEWINGIIDEYPNKIEKKVIGLRLSYLNKILGTGISKEKAIELLKKIDINCVSDEGNSISFEIPYFRHFDLENETDLIEEVARLHGYSKISEVEFDNIFFDTRDYADNDTDILNYLRIFLVGRGFKEMITNTLVNEQHAGMFDKDFIELVNPSSNEMNVIRTNLIVGALGSVKTNLNFKAGSLKLFETGKVMRFNPSQNSLVKGIEEKRYLLLLLAGEFDIQTLNQESRSFDIFDLKGELQVLLEKFHIDNYKLNYYNYNENFEFSLDFVAGNEIVAKAYKMSSRLLKVFDIDKPVLCCEIDLEQVLRRAGKDKFYQEIARYPSVLRDLSIVVDKTIQVNEIEEIIKGSSDGFLKRLRLYDVYDFNQENLNKKSYTFSLEFLSHEKTLTDEEINRVQDKVVKNLQRKLRAELRK
jgi:phenylalanyl-tRNA synthetase beta chain